MPISFLSNFQMMKDFCETPKIQFSFIKIESLKISKPDCVGVNSHFEFSWTFCPFRLDGQKKLRFCRNHFRLDFQDFVTFDPNGSSPYHIWMRYESYDMIWYYPRLQPVGYSNWRNQTVTDFRYLEYFFDPWGILPPKLYHFSQNNPLSFYIIEIPVLSRSLSGLNHVQLSLWAVP